MFVRHPLSIVLLAVSTFASSSFAKEQSSGAVTLSLSPAGQTLHFDSRTGDLLAPSAKAKTPMLEVAPQLSGSWRLTTGHPGVFADLRLEIVDLARCEGSFAAVAYAVPGQPERLVGMMALPDDDGNTLALLDLVDFHGPGDFDVYSLSWVLRGQPSDRIQVKLSSGDRPQIDGWITREDATSALTTRPVTAELNALPRFSGDDAMYVRKTGTGTLAADYVAWADTGKFLICSGAGYLYDTSTMFLLPTEQIDDPTRPATSLFRMTRPMVKTSAPFTMHFESIEADSGTYGSILVTDVRN